MVSENEIGCDDIDKDNKGDKVDMVTQLTGRWNLKGNRLHWLYLDVLHSLDCLGCSTL